MGTRSTSWADIYGFRDMDPWLWERQDLLHICRAYATIRLQNVVCYARTHIPRQTGKDHEDIYGAPCYAAVPRPRCPRSLAGEGALELELEINPIVIERIHWRDTPIPLCHVELLK